MNQEKKKAKSSQISYSENTTLVSTVASNKLTFIRYHEYCKDSRKSSADKIKSVNDRFYKERTP